MDWALLPLSTCNLVSLLVAGNCLLTIDPSFLQLKAPSSQKSSHFLGWPTVCSHVKVDINRRVNATYSLSRPRGLADVKCAREEYRVIHTLRCQDTGTHLCKSALWLLPHATLRYVFLVILCIFRKVCWWTGRCCLYPLRDVWCDGFVRVRCDSMVMQTMAYPSTV